MTRDRDETLWSAWCPLCHRAVSEAATQDEVMTGWFHHWASKHDQQLVQS